MTSSANDHEHRALWLYARAFGRLDAILNDDTFPEQRLTHAREMLQELSTQLDQHFGVTP